MKELFERTQIEGVQFNVIVNNKYVSTICSCSLDNIIHSTPLLKLGIEQINSNRGKSNQRRKQLTTNKRRK